MSAEGTTVVTATVTTTTGGSDTSGADSTSPLPPDVPGSDTFDCRPVWASQGCAAPPPVGPILSAATPLGDFQVSYAVFGADMGCGECVDTPNLANLVLAADSAALVGLGPGLGVDETLTLELLGAFEGPAGDPVPAVLTAHRGGGSEQTDVVVVFDAIPSAVDLGEPYDPANEVAVTGTVTGNDGGWMVQGSFEAAYCPDINLLAICE